MQYGLGIDLGTTQTAAAVRVDGRIEVVRLGGRRAEIPSLVFVQPDGTLLIGEAAERRGQAEPGRLAREFKRRIGDPVPILAGGVPFSAHALTAKLLRHVLDAVIRLQDGPPAVLTVTHPANWGPYKREQLDQALRLADTGPALLRTEPEAAALQHATARRIAPGETVAVYDLGGGTFDAAVLRREGEGFQVLGDPEGIEQLGGADFDEAVFGHVLGVLGNRVEGLDPNEPEVVTALARLRRDCVEAKEALSFDTEVMIPVALPGVHTRVRLNRSELESMIAPALADTVAAMHRALRAAGVAPAELDAVLLAGGSSRIPLVSELLSTAFGRPVVADPHPEHSIAMGAAVATALVTGGASPFAEAVAPPPPPAPQPPAAGSPAGAAAGDRHVVTSARRTAGASAGRAPDVSAPASGVPTLASVEGTPASSDTGSTRTMPGTGRQTTPEISDAGSTQAMPGTGDGRPVTPGDGSDAAATRVMPGHGDGPAGAPVNGDAAATRVMPGSGSGSGPRVDRPVSGGTVHGSAAPVAYSRGAAAVPTRTFPQPTSPAPAAGRAAPPITPGPPVSYPPVPSGAGGDQQPPRRSGRMLILVGTLTLAMIAGTTVLVTYLTRSNDKAGTGAQGPASSLTPSPSGSVPPYPTARMLIQVDTGGTQRPERRAGAFLLTPGGAERTPISTNGDDVLPEWSRDRRRIAVIRYRTDGSNAIWVTDADGGNPRKVVENVTGGRVSWNDDGTRLAFVRRVGDSPQIFTIKIGESKPTQLTRMAGMKDDPAWSPGGGAIAYWRLVGDQPQIFLLNANDPNEPGRQITDGDTGPGVDPNWSPTGKYIAYTHSTGADTSDIWVFESDGGKPRRLTTHEDREMDPSWSPDGSWLAFSRGGPERPQIVIAKADGSAEQTLTRGDAREGHPCWS